MRHRQVACEIVGLERRHLAADQRFGAPQAQGSGGTIEGLIAHFEVVMTNRGFHAPKEECYAAIEAPNGEEGLAKAAAERPDLIILDVRLPGIDGFEALRRLRAAGSGRAGVSQPFLRNADNASRVL